MPLPATRAAHSALRRFTSPGPSHTAPPWPAIQARVSMAYTSKSIHSDHSGSTRCLASPRGSDGAQSQWRSMRPGSSYRHAVLSSAVVPAPIPGPRRHWKAGNGIQGPPAPLQGWTILGIIYSGRPATRFAAGLPEEKSWEDLTVPISKVDRSLLPVRDMEFFQRNIQNPSPIIRLIYILQQLLSWGLMVRATVLFMFSLLVGFLAALATKLNTGMSMGEAFWLAFTVMNNFPGADMCVMETVSSKGTMGHTSHVLSGSRLSPTHSPADEVRTRLEKLEDGNSIVIERNHNVIIGWSKLTVPLLIQAGQ
mmetsp:Transcript_24836/g.69211  ORF Transcript_24836/g.69211 Transcript_24836/m.69211 type:complete len:309 (-) Transcript_24836:276-1202(-)